MRGIPFLLKSIIISLALVMTLLAAQPAKAVDPPTAELNTAFLSQYIWRGQAFSRGSLVIQPELTVVWYGFLFDIWVNLDTSVYDAAKDENSGNAEVTETDLTLAYGRSFGPVYAEGGFLYYALDGVRDSMEFYLSLSLDVLLAPTLTVYREVNVYQNWYLNFGISHSFALQDWMSLDLAASVAYLISENSDVFPDVNDDLVPNFNEEYSGFLDGTFSAALPMSFAKYFTVTPLVAISYGVGGDAENLLRFLNESVINKDDSTFIYGGVNFTFAF